MSSEGCARCGRNRPDTPHRESLAADAPFMSPGEPDGAWAAFDGQEVCPQCQLPEERREAVDRLVAMVEREIERRQSDGIPPGTYEAALVAYAMALRARADPVVDVGIQTPEAERPPGPVQLADAEAPDRLQLRVAVTGAFLTGHPLAVRLDDYTTFQRDLGRALTGPRWSTETVHGSGGTYASGGGFSQHVPLVVARRNGTDLLPWLSAALKDTGTADPNVQGHLLEVSRATPASLAIDVYDLGVAVLTAWFDVDATVNTQLDATAKALKRLAWLRPLGAARSPLAEALQRIATDTAAEYARALAATAPDDLSVSWLSRSNDVLPDEQGRLLWLHPVHVLSTAEPPKTALEQLAPTCTKEVQLDGGLFAAGIGWSAIVVAPDSSAAATPVRLTQLHWAYYALYLEIDRGLLGVLNQPNWSERAPLRQLEADAEAVFADYLRVMDARARLDSALSALGGDELAIWGTIAEVQHFDEVVKAVERKLEALQKLAERRVTQATTDRARQIGNLLGFLSVLTVVTVSIAIIGATLGSLSPGIGTIWVRIASVVAAFVLALFTYWAFFVRSARGKAAWGIRRRSR